MAEFKITIRDVEPKDGERGNVDIRMERSGMEKTPAASVFSFIDMALRRFKDMGLAYPVSEHAIGFDGSERIVEFDAPSPDEGGDAN